MPAVTIDAQYVQAVLPMRQPDAHKGQFGHLLILAGSSQYRGAAVLAAHGALRAGAGIVRLAATEAVCAAAAAQLPCCTLYPLPENAAGGIAPTLPAGLLAPALPAEQSTLAGGERKGPSALLAGCGMGNSADTARLVLGLLAAVECPLVLDADALNTLAGHLDSGFSDEARRRGAAALQAAKVPVVLTPHVGELSRLCGLSAADILGHPAEVGLRFARQNDCVLVLKSHQTLVATPAGALLQNSWPPNPGLAKGGSGDVLAGVIASLLAQGLPAPDAAAAGVWLHSAAAAFAAEACGEAALSPADLPLYLAQAFVKLGR